LHGNNFTANKGRGVFYGNLAEDDHNECAHVEAGSNPSVIVLRAIIGDEKKPCAWEYNWATIFLWNKNTGI
jgi:hypothetical protein